MARPQKTPRFDIQLETIPEQLIQRLLMKKPLMHEEVDFFIGQYAKIQMAFEELREAEALISTVMLAVAYQKVQITAGMLSASDDPLGVSVPDSVLTTLSQSDYEFDWHMAGGVRAYKVVLGPGRGSSTHYVIIDMNDVNMAMQRVKAVGDQSIQQIPSNVARPYGMSGLDLQFGYIAPRNDILEFWPTPIAPGTIIYLEQTLPAVDIP
jgi:hypothetical protein